MSSQPTLLKDCDYEEKIEASQEKVRELLNNNYKNGKRAEVLNSKINNGTITNDEIVELVSAFLAEFERMGLKFFSLYQGVYKKPMESLFDRYPQYFVKEYVKNIEGKTLSQLFKRSAEKLQNSNEGTRGLVNFIRSIGMAKEILETGSCSDDSKFVVLQNFVKSEV